MNITYIKAFENIFGFILTSGRLANLSIHNFSNDFNTFRGNFELKLFFGIILSVCFHIKLRHIIEIYVCKPLIVHLKAKPQNESKVSDSGYKLVYHLTSTLLAIKILFSKDCIVCFNEFKHDHSPSQAIPISVQLLYFFELGHYLFALYSDQFLAAKKKAVHSVLLTIHHVCTFVLLSGSYVTRAHACGTIVAFLHHVNDVAYELGKLSFSLMVQDGKTNQIFKLVLIICAVLFPLTWYICRLYYYPITGLQFALELPPYSSITILVILLLVILAMDIIWGVFMVRFYYRFLTQRRFYDPVLSENEKLD